MIFLRKKSPQTRILVRVLVGAEPELRRSLGGLAVNFVCGAAATNPPLALFAWESAI
jgi:hypothetical protein